MKLVKTLLIAFTMTFLFSSQSFAGGTHSGQAVLEGGQVSTHASASVAHATVGTAQLTSAASAAPLYVIGAAGAISTAIADGLIEAATVPAGTPLAVSDECVTAGPPPDKALERK